LITSAGPVAAAEAVVGAGVSLQHGEVAAPDGVHSYSESSTMGVERRVTNSQRMDFTRLQGAGLLLSETMLGTMDERLGIDADARGTTKRVWLRVGGAFQGGGRQQQVGQYRSEASRYRAATLTLGTDFYRTPTQRAGAFVGMGTSTFGSDQTIEGYKLVKPSVSAASLGLYYNHNSMAGWYLDGAVQMARLNGEFGQGQQDYTGRAFSASERKSAGKATNSGTAFAVRVSSDTVTLSVAQ
jgi:outer membrane autotransporter protein